MKKIVPHILFFLISFSSYSQGVFFNMGKNFSTISYKNRSAFTEKLDINGVGDAYEIGYTDVLKYKNFKDLKFTGSFTINDYNAIAESALNRLEWKTTYLGVQSTVDYQFYDAFFFFLSARAGLNLSTIVRGKQTVNNAAYDLVGNNEFSGIVLQPNISLDFQYTIIQNIKILFKKNTIGVFLSPLKLVITSLFNPYFYNREAICLL